MKPIRIQRKRTKGWKMPENTVYVGRPTVWGNPFLVKEGLDGWVVNSAISNRILVKDSNKGVCLGLAINLYIEHISDKIFLGLAHPIDILEKNLACFCPLEQLCHADVLLSWCNHILSDLESITDPVYQEILKKHIVDMKYRSEFLEKYPIANTPLT